MNEGKTYYDIDQNKSLFQNMIALFESPEATVNHLMSQLRTCVEGRHSDKPQSFIDEEMERQQQILMATFTEVLLKQIRKNGLASNHWPTNNRGLDITSLQIVNPFNNIPAA